MNSASTSVSVKTTSERKFTTKPKPGQQVDLEVSQIIQIKIATRFLNLFWFVNVIKALHIKTVFC
jgi:hypothetical protein